MTSSMALAAAARAQPLVHRIAVDIRTARAYARGDAVGNGTEIRDINPRSGEAGPAPQDHWRRDCCRRRVAQQGASRKFAHSGFC